MKILYWTGAGIGNLIQATPAFKFLVNNGHELYVYPEDVPVGTLDCIFPFSIDKEAPTFLSKRPVETSEYDYVIYSEFRGLHNPPTGNNVVRPKMLWWKEPEAVYHIRICADLLKLPYPDEYKFHVLPTKTDFNVDIKRIVLAPCGKSAQSIKKWGGFPSLSKELLSKGYDVSVVGRREDFDQKKFPGTTLFVNQPLKMIGELLASVDLVIANDCGIMHYANAIGVKTYGIFGPTSIIKNCPSGVIPIADTECAIFPCQEKFSDWQVSYRRRCLKNCLEAISSSKILKTIGLHGVGKWQS